MKQILLLLISVTGFAQSMSLTENITIGQNCGNGQTTELTVNGDLNLNGYTITLRNVFLTVTGNLNGSGEITRCGNFDHSSICVTGSIQNGVNTNGIRCNTLGTNEFELSSETIGLLYKVYDLIGREVQSGKVDVYFYRDLPKVGVIIVKVDGYVAFKTFR